MSLITLALRFFNSPFDPHILHSASGFNRAESQRWSSRGKLYKQNFQLTISDPFQIDLVSWMARTALELIGQSGLGYSFDSLVEDATPHRYSDSVKKLMWVSSTLQIETYLHGRSRPTISRISFLRAYLLIPALKIGTPEFRRFVVDLLPWKNLHDVRDIVDVIYHTSVEIFESNKMALADGDEALATQIGRGKDIMSILSEYIITFSLIASCSSLH